MRIKTCSWLVVVWLSGATVVGQNANDQWLIVETKGDVQVSHRGEKPSAIGRYDVVTRKSRLYCGKPPCSLGYYSPADAKVVTVSLTRPQSSFDEMRVSRPASINAKGFDEFVELLATKAVPAGRRKNTPTCHGDLPLTAPTCGETIDPEEFTVRWEPQAASTATTYTLLIGSTDSSERRRWNGLSSATGEFSALSVLQHLRRLQLRDRPTDVTIRLMRTSTLDAVRLVRLSSRVEQDERRQRQAERAQMPHLPRQLADLKDYIEAEMWSRAADVSRQLLRDAPRSIEIQKYALVGLCHSGEAAEIVRLRSALKKVGTTDICKEEADAP